MLNIHVMGASGSGTTTLGQALAGKLGLRHLDTDHFFWMPTDPPFTTQRPVEARVAMLRQAIQAADGWVLSGSALKWAAEFEPLYDLIVFLRIDPVLRMARIREREETRYGDRIKSGGDMAEKSQQFLEWAESYDTAGPERRSAASHEEWLKGRATPLLRLDSSEPVDSLVAEVLRHPAVKTKGPLA
ncbi:AAA family ATPase [Rhizobium sp. BE258]|uniref:ATP-binding protein n=1 Tax=Rhizobium sp. BE258 TaxID=2817722 RepID=UPI00285E83D4|nr:AAA family ATPase [Rhizobium sp. BE258]MDR7145607.1 adenylate kinase family enzyme [Rhizobium sp. BE258]